MISLRPFAVIMVLSIVLGAPAMPQSAKQSQCVVCHMETESDTGPAHDFSFDIHFQKGLGCADCHGGDPDVDDMDKVRASAGWRGVPGRSAVPEFCGRCHSDAGYMHEHNPRLPIDQLDKYKTSVHGQRLFQKGDPKVATCVSCHTAHKIGDAAMPHSTTNPANIPSTCGACHSNAAFMAEYGIPTDQEELYRESVHGKAVFIKKDLTAPVCNDCHGNHGAAPPGASSLSAVCGMCHAIEADLYVSSPHFEAFAAQGLPMCETCHGNHGIGTPTHALIGLQEGQLCGNCHSPGEGTTAPQQIDSMRAAFESLTEAVDSSQYLVSEAAVRGMMVTDIEFALKDIDQVLIHMRSSVHAFDVDSLIPYATDGLEKSRAVQAGAAALIHEYYFRRWGLGISSVLITFLAIALYLKIRALDRPRA